MKKCKQCGAIKPQDQYRPYYGGRTGSYNTCKDCERINSRVKYLNRKANWTPEEKNELTLIYDLWEAQRRLGLKPPTGRSVVKDIVNSMLADVKEHINAVPPELQEWLDCLLEEEPTYYQDEVYDKLMEKYRPITGIDQHTMARTYDDTYKEVMDQIQARFDAYEDAYYNGV